MTAEAKIQNDIRVALSARGCTIIRTNTGSVKTADGRRFNAGPPNGWPDLTGYRHSDGKMILIECKTERGRLRDDQKRFAAMITKRAPNVLYGVCRSVDDALKLIERE
jgi:hypothetical protein